MTSVVFYAIQAVFGAFVIYWMRNDENEDLFGLVWGRSLWLGVASIAGAMLIAFRVPSLYHNNTIAASAGFIAFGLLMYLLTAPHGQTLRGPHQEIPPEEDDPCFEVAMFVSGHQGGAGDRLGWPTWLIYNGLRYVFPAALLGAVLGSWPAALSGVLSVIGYWPVGHLLSKRIGIEPQFIGAFVCGAVVFGGL